MWQPAALIGRFGWGAAWSQRRPGRRPATQHPGARPVPSRRTRVRGGHAPSVCRRTHLAAAGRPGRRCRASVLGQPDQAVQRMAMYAERSAFRAAWLPDGVQAADRRGVRDSADPRLPLRRTGRGRPGPGPRDWPTADQSRSGRSAQCCAQANHYRNRRIMPAPDRNAAPPKSARQPSPVGQGQPGHAIGVVSARTASSRPGQPRHSRPQAGTGLLAV